jgi:hypothetical protein
MRSPANLASFPLTTFKFIREMYRVHFQGARGGVFGVFSRSSTNDSFSKLQVDTGQEQGRFLWTHL